MAPQHIMKMSNTRVRWAVLACAAASVITAAVLGFTGTVAGLALSAAFVFLAIVLGRIPVTKTLAFPVTVVAVVTAAMYFPERFTELNGFDLRRTIVPLVQVIMLGMGMTLTVQDFVRVARMPHAVLIGLVLQFSVMPLTALACAVLFRLEPEVAAGLILFGSCAGGVASNVMAYLARANVALSVTMTACSTLAAPFLTPSLTKWLAGQYVPIAFWPMMISILKMIIVPLVLGLILNRYAARWIKPLKNHLAGVSMLAIAIIIGVTIGWSRDDLLRVGVALFAAAVCHNAAGFSLGYGLARALRLSRRNSRTVAIEVGMQNGGMATGLAFNVLNSAQAAMASAIEGPWGAVVASGLACLWRGRPDMDDQAGQVDGATPPAANEEA